MKARRAMSWIGVRELGYSGTEGTKRKTLIRALPEAHSPDAGEYLGGCCLGDSLL